MADKKTYKFNHKQRHIDLHASLDELIADWICHTKGRPSKCTIMKLIEWSHKQIIKPDEK